MISSSARRHLRRFTSLAAGTALVAGSLALAAAPAQAADSVVTGNVTDAQGNPVGGTVRAYQLQPDGITYFQVATEYPDYGHFELTVPDGTYKFKFTTRTGVSEYFLDKPDLATADTVTVGGGSTALPAWTVEQPFLTGTVVGTDGNPLKTYVYAYDATTQLSGGSAATDDKGNFVLPVGTDPVKLQISATGNYASEWFNDKPTFATADPVTGTPTGNSVGVVTLGTGSTIYGQVTSDAGAPLEMVRVSANNNSSDLTDKFGFYAIDNLAPGAYKVNFYDYVGEYASEYYNNAPDSASATPVDVGLNQPVSVNAALTPLPAQPATSIEATGSVKDELGAPIVGAKVEAFNTPVAGGKRQVVEVAISNRAGVYTLDELDQVAGENQFKLLGSSDGQGDDNAFALFERWYGTQQSYDRATVLTTTPPTPVSANIVLGRAGGMEGSITGVTGLPIYGQASVYSSDGDLVEIAGSKADHSFELRNLPADTYKVLFSDFYKFHAPEWWKDAVFADAMTITVKPGQLTGGLNAVLGATLNAVERPEVKGYPWVGKPISADRGKWNVENGTVFTYEWLVGSTVVGTGPAFTPSKSNIGDRLVVRVSAENGRLVGSATTTSTAKIGYKPKLKISVTGDKAAITVKASPLKAKKVTGTVVVKEIVKVKNDGTIKYKKIATTKIRKGKGAVSLAKLKKGTHKLVFFFKGKGKTGSNDVKVKVKIKR